jgi:hypothetical protein
MLTLLLARITAIADASSRGGRHRSIPAETINPRSRQKKILNVNPRALSTL